MKKQICIRVIALGVVLGLMAPDAMAWGPRARRVICSTAFQVIRDANSDAFKTPKNNYEGDVLSGARLGAEVLAGSVPMNSEEEMIAAIDNEIQLLREVRQYGTGSYYAFRMGVLSTMVANAVVPFGMAWSPQDLQLQTRIEKNLDEHLNSYRFLATRPHRTYVRNASEYFRTNRQFYADNKKMILDDYTRGKGYDGFLMRGGQAYFCRAIDAVADAWYTAFRIESSPNEVPPSSPVVARYLVNQIGYLLNEKRNFHQANQAYKDFSAVNPDLWELCERVGDLYYAYGTDAATLRGINEWRIAHNNNGPHKRRVALKLSAHFMHVGNAYLKSAAQVESNEQALPNAREAFEQALEFDRRSDIAAQKLNETRIAIREREERRTLAIRLISAIEQVVAQAERSRLNKEFGTAISSYSTARNQLNEYMSGMDEFKEQHEAAQQLVKNIGKALDDIIVDILDAADAEIATGDSAQLDRNWKGALSAYERAEEIIAVVPLDDPMHTENKERAANEIKQKMAEVRAAQDADKQREEDNPEDAGKKE